MKRIVSTLSGAEGSREYRPADAQIAVTWTTGYGAGSVSGR